MVRVLVMVKQKHCSCRFDVAQAQRDGDGEEKLCNLHSEMVRVMVMVK